MLFEKILQIEPTKCIELSEAHRKSMHSTAHMKVYLQKFRDMIELIKCYATTPLLNQPLFIWHDRNSSSWAFEENRILYHLHNMLIEDSKKCFDAGDHKGAKVLLSQATDVCKSMLQMDYVKTPYVTSMPELQLEHRLALLFRTKAAYCFNMHMFKTTPAVALMAYKFCEIGNRLWKRDANLEFENKLKAHWHHAVASTSEDDFVKVISHSTKAVELLPDNTSMLEDHEEWTRRNESVHFVQAEPVECDLYTLEQALEKL